MPAAAVRPILIASLLAWAAPAWAVEVLRLASDEWCPYVCERRGRVEGGFVVEVTTKALAMSGVRVVPYLMPLNRAMQQTVAGNLEGVFAPPDDSRLRPSSAIGYSRSCLYTLPRSTWTYRGVWSLAGQRLGVIGDYEYDNGPVDDYILAHRRNRAVIDFSFGATAGSTNVKKLLGARFDVLLEHEQVMRRLASSLGIEHQLRHAGCLEHPFALRVGFSPTHKRSAWWIAALARGVKALEKSGELAQLRSRYGIEARDDTVRARPQSLF